MPAVKKELAGREDLALALANFHPTLAALPLPPLPGYLAPLPAVAALPPAASLPATAAGYEGLLAPPLRTPRAYLSLHEAAPHLHLPRDPLALERFSATAAAAPDFQPLLDNGEPCIEVECGANRALLYVRKLCQGSKGPSIRHRGEWLTPNEFQFVSGRETAKDWKRSIRHKGAPAAGTRPPRCLTSAPRGSVRRDPTHPPSGETPSPPREGAVAPGLPQGHSSPRPPPLAWHRGPGQGVLGLHRSPGSRCALASCSWRPGGLGRIAGPRGAGKFRELGRAGGRRAGQDTRPHPDPGDPEPRVLAGVEGTRAARWGASCWREGRGVGLEQAGGAAGPRVRSGARAEQERRRSWEHPVGLPQESGSSGVTGGRLSRQPEVR